MIQYKKKYLFARKCRCCNSYLLRVLRVVLAQVDRDLAELGLVHAVGGGGHVPVVQQHPAALVRRDADVDLRK